MEPFNYVSPISTSEPKLLVNENKLANCLEIGILRIAIFEQYVLDDCGRSMPSDAQLRYLHEVEDDKGSAYCCYDPVIQTCAHIRKT